MTSSVTIEPVEAWVWSCAQCHHDSELYDFRRDAEQGAEIHDGTHR